MYIFDVSKRNGLKGNEWLCLNESAKINYAMPFLLSVLIVLIYLLAAIISFLFYCKFGVQLVFILGLFP